jgi:hypothetical protein
MGDLGKVKKYFHKLPPYVQDRMIAHDLYGESEWIKKMSRLAMSNTRNMGIDRDEELRRIATNEDVDY